MRLASGTYIHPHTGYFNFVCGTLSAANFALNIDHQEYITYESKNVCMGVKLGDLINEYKTKIDLDYLGGKTIAIDGFVSLYQFITTIRQRDGTPLMNVYGKITSHLAGMFYRNVNLLEKGIKPVYVFDGRHPALKDRTIKQRVERKEKAKKMLEIAKEEGKDGRKYAMQAAKLEKYMITDAIELLDALGIPVVISASEGEAQTAYMVKKGDVWASASQDYDSLLFGSERFVRNVNIVGRRKLPGRDAYVEITPELIILKDILEGLEINQDQLIWIGLLIGTDFNEGVKGIGPKKAYKIVKETPIDEIVQKYFDESIWDVYRIFKEPNITENYEIKFDEPNREKIWEILVEKNDFSGDRVKKQLEKLEKTKQRKITEWF